MKIPIKPILLYSCFLVMATFKVNSQTVDLTASKIICFEREDPLVLKSISILKEEIAKRSSIELPVGRRWPKITQAVIAVALEDQLEKFPKTYQNAIGNMPAIGAEGYKISVLTKTNTVLVVGHDARGVLYGIGKLLRKMEISRGNILLPNNLQIASTPKYPIRGHQLGYRPKTNSYDAWSAGQFDSYIRDLAVFGANSIEIMPPRTDDDFTSVHMQIP